MTKEFRIFKAALPESLQAAFDGWYDRLVCKLEVAEMDLTDALRGNLSLAEYAAQVNKNPAPTSEKAIARNLDLEVGK
jgi:hypothetical protein